MAGDARAMETTVRGGLQVYTNSRSIAPSHMMDPVVGLEVSEALSPLLDLGGAVLVNLAESDEYSLMGAMALVRTPLYRCDRVGSRVLLGWAVGLGTGPEILSSDLRVRSDLALWHELSLDTRFNVGPTILGAGLALQQLSVLSATVTVGMEL